MARTEAAEPAARSPATPGRGTATAAGILALQRTAGNAAVKRILARDPLPKGERWFRGQASDVARTKPGQVVHDLADGVYYTSSASAAQGYGDLRAKDNPGSKSSTGGFTIDRALLGRVLDLPKDPRWGKFLDSATPHRSMGASWRAYMSKTTEFFNSGFRTFLDQNKIKYTTIGTHVSALPDFDAVIAEDLIRNPKTQQMVITNPAVVARVDAATKVVHVVEANAPPTPIGKGRGAGGGRLPDAPRLQVDRSGRVKLYRTIVKAELQALVKHGDFSFAPSGGGKYFSFSAEDALALAAKSPGGAEAYTLIETTVPRSFLPETTDTVHKVNQPHLPARPGPASLIQGDVIIQVDRQGAGWALHVDDEALTAMNKLITRPEIVQSPGTPKVPAGGSSHGTPPAKPPDKPAPKDPPRPPLETKDPPRPPAKSPGNAGGTVAERGGAPTPIEVPAPAQRMHEKQGAHAGAALMLLSMQLSNIRSDERQKAEKRLEELGPRIEELRRKGFGVTVRLVVEIPDQVDIAAVWAGIGDVTQVVYFHDMSIIAAGPPIKPMERPPGVSDTWREPPAVRQNEAYDENEPRRREWYLDNPKKGFHFAHRDLQLPGYQVTKTDPPQPAGAVYFRPVKVDDNDPVGRFNNVGDNRFMYIDGGGIHMWNTYSNHGYRRTDAPANEQEKFLPRRLKLAYDVKDERHTVDAYLEWRNGADGKSIEVEELSTFDNLERVPRHAWTARITWAQVRA